MLTEDLQRLIKACFALIFLSFPIQYLPSLQIRKFYSLILALIIQFYVYQSSMYPIYIQHLLVFAIIKLKGPKCGAILTFQSIAYLSGYHIYEYLYNYGVRTNNASGLLMILVCKYSLLGYALEDGTKDDQKLSKEQKQNKIVEQISFLDFLGYLNFLPTCLYGPPFEYKDYKNFIQQTSPYDKIPSVLKIVLKTLGETVICASIYVASEQLIPFSYIKEDEFYEHGFWYVLYYSVFSVALARFKYYFAWKLSMSSVHASGVSFDGKEFKKINTVDPLMVQASIHIREKISNWNISVQEWIRKCIYQRSPLSSRTVNQLYAFMVSAFWHGFYSAYYISFFLWFCQVHLHGIIFKYIQNQDAPLRKAYKRLGSAGYWILSFLVFSLFNHNGSYFLILDGASCFRLLQKVYFIPQILMFALIAIFTVLPTIKKVKVPTKDRIQPPSQKKQ